MSDSKLDAATALVKIMQPDLFSSQKSAYHNQDLYFQKIEIDKMLGYLTTLQTEFNITITRKS